MSDSDSDDFNELISKAASKRPALSAAPKPKPAAPPGAGQAQVERAILGKRNGGAVDLEALLKGAKKRDVQRQESEQALERLTKENAAAAEAASAPAPEAAAPEAAPKAAAENGASAGEPETPVVFARLPGPLGLRPLSCADSPDPMLKALSSADNALPLVEGGWVQAHFAHRQCPAAILRWLFALTSYHPKPAIAAAATRALACLLERPAQPAWTPSPLHFLRALSDLGAEPAVLGEAALDEQGALPDETDDPPATQERSLADVRHNLLGLLGLSTSCAPHWRALPGPEQRRAAQWVWRLTIDTHATPAFMQLQDTLGRLFDAPAEAAWQMEWLPWASAAVRAIGDLADESLVKLCEFLPPTARGQQLQRRAAHAAIELLLERRQPGAAAARAEDAGEGEEEEVVECDEDGGLEGLGRLLAALEIRAWAAHMSNLHSVLLLLDLAVSSDAAGHRARSAALSALSRQLRALKQKVMMHKAGLDYHAIEVESLLTFLPNKLTQVYA